MLTDSEVVRLLDIANAGINKGEIALAREIYRGVLACRPDHAPAHIGMALSHTAVGEYEVAEQILSGRVLSKNPDDADALAYLGLNYYCAGRKDEAAEVLRRVPVGTTAAALASSLLENI